MHKLWVMFLRRGKGLLAYVVPTFTADNTTVKADTTAYTADATQI